MERGIGPVIINQNGLRFVRTDRGNLIDQYGRVFADDGGTAGRYLGVGWAIH